jgi:DNA-binding NarL/FixJ family response regulator
MIRVFMVDDRAGVRRGLRASLESEGDIQVVAEAESGLQAVSIARQVAADVVLLNVRSPGGEGFAAARTLSAPPLSLPIVLAGGRPPDAQVLGAIRAGVVGFLLKTSGQADFARAIRAAARGAGFLAPELTLPVFAAVAARTDRDGVRNLDTGGLTPREVEIVRAVCRCPSDNQAIARQLHVEPATVKGHLKHIMTKLDLHSRADLVVWAFRHQVVA